MDLPGGGPADHCGAAARDGRVISNDNNLEMGTFASVSVPILLQKGNKIISKWCYKGLANHEKNGIMIPVYYI